MERNGGWYSLLQDYTENRVSRVLGAELPPTPEPRLGCLCPQTAQWRGLFSSDHGDCSPGQLGAQAWVSQR